MRLIDGDKLLRHLNHCALSASPGGGSLKDQMIAKVEYDTIQNCIKAVEEQPTAYNVDAVIRELERDKFIDMETVLSDVHQGYNAGLSRAMEIVKGESIRD